MRHHRIFEVVLLPLGVGAQLFEAHALDEQEDKAHGDAHGHLCGLEDDGERQGIGGTHAV